MTEQEAAMAEPQDNGDRIRPARCLHCRYWFERCCHALALMEGDDQHPAKCSHFVIDTAQARPAMAATPW